MPWPHVVEPAEILQTRWWFSQRGGWRPESAEPAAANTIKVLLRKHEYWDLHAFVTGFWSERYDNTGSEYVLWARPPSQMIPWLARDDDQSSRFIDYASTSELSEAPQVLHRAARELIRIIPELERFNDAAIVTVNEIDQLVEECRRRYPNGGEEFRRCIRGRGRSSE